MQFLTRVGGSESATYYEIGGDHDSPVNRYIVSTAETRELCNRPDLVGCEYTDRLETAVTKALEAAPFRGLIEGHREHRVCVLNFLRGGLNFGIRSALHRAFGMNRHSSAFMSSQRSRTEDGRWQVREDMYRKLEIPSGSLIIAGDVVATGITIENGLEVLVEHLKSIGSSIRHVVFFTIGCHKLEKVLNALDARLRESFDDYESCQAVYFEGKFKLVDSKSELRIGIQGTDLLRRNCLLAPEFEASQWERVAYPLERCTIYDAGSRAFDIPRYAADVLEYWEQVQGLAEGGFTLREAIEERFSTDDFSTFDRFVEARQGVYRGLDNRAMRGLYQAYESRWVDRPSDDFDSSKALLAVASRRVSALRDQRE
jgi:hypoxanthine-guanine phosphoribosyltransferase